MIISRNFIPSLFTVLNAFCGFLSIISSSNGDFTGACYFIIYATLFDAVDGLAARLTNSSSRFGVELDSLSDVVSFGIAPSFLAYKIYLFELDEIGVILSSLIMVFAALRLARFNIQLVGFDKDKFNGLPAPMSALTLISYILFYHNEIFSGKTSRIVLIALSVLLPVLMLSKIKYVSLPKPTLSNIKKYPIIFTIIVIAAILIIATKGEGIFSFCLFYIFSGILKSFIGLFKGKNMRQKEIDEDEVDDHLSLKRSD
ncbi:MAG: hypothetical protein HGGPFJEG_00780 [Ignavibacteria bacterium]|nr:hypothetical protein [Ignavibacteria bacterium]